MWVNRRTGAYAIGGAIALVSTLILLNFDSLFGLVITVTTRYSQPLIGFVFCIYVGWIWHRDQLLQELPRRQSRHRAGPVLEDLALVGTDSLPDDHSGNLRPVIR